MATRNTPKEHLGDAPCLHCGRVLAWTVGRKGGAAAYCRKADGGCGAQCTLPAAKAREYVAKHAAPEAPKPQPQLEPTHEPKRRPRRQPEPEPERKRDDKLWFEEL